MTARNLDAVRERRDVLAREIRALVDAFEHETGTVVERVDVDHAEVVDARGGRQPILTRVLVSVGL